LVQEYGLVKMQEGLALDECNAGRDVIRREREELERMKDVLIKRRVRAEEEAIEERRRADDLELKLGEIEAMETGLEGRILVVERREGEIEARESGANALLADLEIREVEVRTIVGGIEGREKGLTEGLEEVKRREREVGEVERGKVREKEELQRVKREWKECKEGLEKVRVRVGSVATRKKTILREMC